MGNSTSASGPGGQSTDGYSVRKDEFRNRILDAAEALVLKNGDVSFSTRDLAKHADVSFATPFNHFGSKSGILDAVIERSLVNMPHDTTPKSGDQIDRMLVAANVVIKYYSKQSKLYRPIFGAILGRTSNAQSPAAARAIAMWRHSLSQAKSEGLISADRDIDVIADLIEYNWIGSVLSWIDRSLNAEEWRDLVTYNIALTLCGVVVDARRPELLKKAVALEKRVGKFL